MLSQSTVESNEENIQFIQKSDYQQQQISQIVQQQQNIYQFDFLNSNRAKKKINKRVQETEEQVRKRRLVKDKKKGDGKLKFKLQENNNDSQGSVKINPLDQLLFKVKEQLKGNTFKSRSDYQTIGLYQNIKFNDAEHLFGDVHLEFNLQFIDTYFNPNNSSMESNLKNPQERFTKFQFWRPCMYSEYNKEEKLVKYQIVPNIYNRTSDYSRFISLYKKSNNQMVREWAAKIEIFQNVTLNMKSQMKAFLDQINASQSKKQYFNQLKEQFHLQSQNEIQKLSTKYMYFVYYFGCTNLETCDFQIDHYGVSENFIDLLGPNREDTAKCIMKYGLPFFMTQLTRIQRYMNDFSFLLNGKRIQEKQEFITFDEYNLESSMTPNIYEMEFTQQQINSMPPEMIMFLRIAMHFRVDVYTFEPNTLKQLKAKRDEDKKKEISLDTEYKFYCNSCIFKNELVEKYYPQKEYL